MHVRAYAEREARCTRACAWGMCMGNMHVHADGHSGHVLVECVRADCLLVLPLAHPRELKPHPPTPPRIP